MGRTSPSSLRSLILEDARSLSEMAPRLERRTEVFQFGEGKSVVNWVEIDLRGGPRRWRLRVAAANHPRGREDLLKVADSLRRIKAAGAGSVRGSVTKDDVLVVSRSSGPGPNPKYRLQADGSVLLGRDAVEFEAVRQMVASGRLRARRPPECTELEATNASTLEDETLKALMSESRVLYSVRTSAVPPGGSQLAWLAVAPTLPVGFAAHYESLPEICARHRARAGINGGFFANFDEELSAHTVFNDPVGLLMIDRQVIVPPSYRRGTLLISADEGARIDVIDMSATRFSVGGRPFASAKGADSGDAIRFELNSGPVAEVGVYTCSFGDRSPEGESTDFVVSGGSVVEVRKPGGSRIPQNGFVLQIRDRQLARELLARVTRGDNSIDCELDVQGLDEPTEYGIAAGPILLKRGTALSPDYFECRPPVEEFDEGRLAPTRLRLSVADPRSRAPRSAVGIKDRETVLLVTVDDDRRSDAPSQERYSVGATLSELADIMRQLGCSEALNLDGGGSSTLWFEGQVVNRPSDGFARSIPTAILVVPSP